MPPKVNRPRPGGSVDIVEVQGRPGAPADPATLLEHVNPYEAPSRDDDGNLISLPVVNGADISTAIAGQIPISNGDGTWTVGDVGGAADFDGGTPSGTAGSGFNFDGGTP